MENKITFLGTGGDAFVIGKQIRASGGIILQTEGLQFHIDPGPGALVRAAENGINLRGNTAVIATCNHISHCNDINAVISAMTYAGFDKRGVLVASNSVVNTEEKYLTEFHKNCLEKIIVLKSGQRLGIEDIEIHALPANHTDPDTIGLKFITNDFILTYSSDTAYSKALIKAYKDSDILILNVPLPGDEKKEGQLNTSEAAKIIEEVNPKLAIITHFGIKMLKADPLYEARQIQKQTNVQVLVAKDGFTISPASYAAKSTQKRLSGFSKDKGNQIPDDAPDS
jgi:ribonuclease BN (tRNA processing enzyme)